MGCSKSGGRTRKEAVEEWVDSVRCSKLDMKYIFLSYASFARPSAFLKPMRTYAARICPRL
jgi:hypothetical protein